MSAKPGSSSCGLSWIAGAPLVFALTSVTNDAFAVVLDCGDWLNTEGDKQFGPTTGGDEIDYENGKGDFGAFAMRRRTAGGTQEQGMHHHRHYHHHCGVAQNTVANAIPPRGSFSERGSSFRSPGGSGGPSPSTKNTDDLAAALGLRPGSKLPRLIRGIANNDPKVIEASEEIFGFALPQASPVLQRSIDARKSSDSVKLITALRELTGILANPQNQQKITSWANARIAVRSRDSHSKPRSKNMRSFEPYLLKAKKFGVGVVEDEEVLAKARPGRVEYVGTFQ